MTYNPLLRMHQKFATPARVQAYLESVAGSGQEPATDTLSVNGLEVLDPNNDGMGEAQGYPSKVVLHAQNERVAWILSFVNDTAGPNLATTTYVSDTGEFFLTSGGDLVLGSLEGDTIVRAGEAVTLRVERQGYLVAEGADIIPAYDNAHNLGLDSGLASWKNLSVYDIKMKSGTSSVILPPTSDPHIVGALWNNAGTPTISQG